MHQTCVVSVIGLCATSVLMHDDHTYERWQYTVYTAVQ